MSISSKIQSLITAANSVTGESRTDLTSAVQDLKDGYGQGGEQSVIICSKCGAGATVTATSGIDTYTATADYLGNAKIFVDKTGIFTLTSSDTQNTTTATVTALSTAVETMFPRVPSEYEDVDVITFRGAYINTGVAMTQDTEVGYKVKYKQYQAYHHLFVQGQSNSYNFSAPRRTTSGVVKMDWSSGATLTPTPTSELAALDEWFCVITDFGNDKIEMNGDEYSVSPSITTRTFPSYNLYFGTYNGQTSSGFPFYGDVEHFYIKQNGIYVRDYWACKRNSDGARGFYENVTSAFVQPSGTYL